MAETEEDVDFREGLRQEMKAKHYSQKQMGAVIGINQQNMSCALLGKSKISEDRKEALAAELGTSVEKLVEIGAGRRCPGYNHINMSVNHGTVSQIVSGEYHEVGELARDVCDAIIKEMSKVSLDAQIELRKKILDTVKDWKKQ